MNKETDLVPKDQIDHICAHCGGDLFKNSRCSNGGLCESMSEIRERNTAAMLDKLRSEHNGFVSPEEACAAPSSDVVRQMYEMLRAVCYEHGCEPGANKEEDELMLCSICLKAMKLLSHPELKRYGGGK